MVQPSLALPGAARPALRASVSCRSGPPPVMIQLGSVQVAAAPVMARRNGFGVAAARGRGLTVQAAAQEDGEAPRYIGWQGRTDVPDELEPWQVDKMELALTLSKKELDIQALARDVNLPRKEVLAWLKVHRPARASSKAKAAAPQPGDTAAADLVGVEGEEQLEDAYGVYGEDGEEGWDDEPPRRRRKERGLRSTKMRDNLTGHEPAWVRSYAEKRMSAEVEKTLENIYRRHKRPSEEVITGIQELTGLSKQRCREWFMERRQRH